MIHAMWPIGKLHGNRMYWACYCDCGTTVYVRAGHLQSGDVKSCGCLLGRPTTHGMKLTPEYQAYSKAKQRCNNSNHPQYSDYGGRGIEFRFKSFEEFYVEIGLRPKGLTLDRINNDGHYEVGNVRWATWKEQANNRRFPRTA